MKLSIPNPTREMLPANKPATTATNPSRAFHAMVKYSSLRPRRTIVERSRIAVSAMPAVYAKDVVSALGEIEPKPGREVNPTVFGPREFREKLAAKNHFLSTVAKEKKLFVIGDEREFHQRG
jgi:hypothetical protein